MIRNRRRIKVNFGWNRASWQGWFARVLVPAALLVVPGISLHAESSAAVVFTQSAPAVAAYDFVEVTAKVAAPTVKNPFTDASISGDFEPAGSTEQVAVEGFCDAADGSVYRIRFMPSKSGSYTYHVTYKDGAVTQTYSGAFTALDQHLRGPIRDDPAYPWHFIWEGTGEHYFFNGTTAYWLAGWRNDDVIQYSIDRLHRLKVNRMRVTIAGREEWSFLGEPVMNTNYWTANTAAWLAQNADDPLHPGFDYTRFNLPYWQKFERMLKYARDRDMIVSLVLDMNDSKVHPAAGSEDERRFIRYAIDRFGAYSNITWDLGDDLDFYRDEKWTHETGTLIEQWDPYRHLATSHPVNTVHQDRASSWFGFTSYQNWERNQHALMLESRKLQEQAGRIIPQTNEEYGYEDDYPIWAAPGSDSADVLRRTAWDIYMAGGYQTTGESARRGTNIWPDTGGGWINGRGDDTQTMFLGYGHIVDFFTSFEWWKANPHDELVDNGNYCLAEPGKLYAVYLPHGGKTTVKLEPGTYSAELFNATSGQRFPLDEDAVGPSWTSPDPPHNTPDPSTTDQWLRQQDWAILLRRR